METALTLPLVVFLMLGTMQLFLLTHGRILAQLAAYRATRVGSTNQGKCKPMVDAALLTLMPAIDPFLGRPVGSAADKLVAAFGKRKTNRYDDNVSGGGSYVTLNGPVVWIDRTFVGNNGGGDFDTPGQLVRLESRLVFWFPMRIPFANWVLARMYLAQAGIQDYAAQNPLMMTQKASWAGAGGVNPNPNLAEFRSRVEVGQYVFPIQTTFTMRMMTPLAAGVGGGVCP